MNKTSKLITNACLATPTAFLRMVAVSQCGNFTNLSDMNISLQRRCKKYISYGVWTVLLWLFFFSYLSAQDIHFSQFYNSPLNLSPALTGVHGGDVRFMGNYRNQWKSVPVPYLTVSGMYDTKIQEDARKKGYFSGGILFNYDRAGLSKLSMTNFVLSGSYTFKVQDGIFLTGGAQASVNQRAFRIDDLRFGSQWDGEIFNGNLPPETFDNTTNFFADFGLGANLRFQNANANRWDKRSKLDVGVALFHINRPKVGFYDNESLRLPSRVSIYALGVLMVAPAFDLVLNGSVQIQNPYLENVAGFGARLHLDRRRAREAALQIGASWRFGKNPVFDDTEKFASAIIPNVELHYRQWMVGVSYDVDISNFNIATNKRGGPEVAISYTIYRVKPLPAFKICPII